MIEAGFDEEEQVEKLFNEWNRLFLARQQELDEQETLNEPRT